MFVFEQVMFFAIANQLLVNILWVWHSCCFAAVVYCVLMYGRAYKQGENIYEPNSYLSLQHRCVAHLYTGIVKEQCIPFGRNMPLYNAS